jgi:hypothetical protein
MPEPARVRRKPGPNTPEGKARSARNALKHGLRSRSFGLLPEESAEEWAEHLSGLRGSYRPQDAAEEKLLTALAAAMWLEIRADRTLVETMARIVPDGPGRSHGTDLQDPANARALATALRYQAAAGMATSRAQRAFLVHRKAVKDGLVEAPECEPATAECTNEFPVAPANQNEAEPPPLGRTVAGGAAGEALDDDAWLEALPAVEADPALEARRRAALARVEPPLLRRTVGHATLNDLEQLLAVSDPDPTVYEAWFARQPKPPREPAPGLTAEDAAIVEHVTRHNPPWIRGPYLGYHRPPVPAELFRPEAAAPPQAVARAEPAPPPPDLAARVARLLDRAAPRLADELDLAEAICAVKWPNWPAYGGAVDLDLLRTVLRQVRLDPATLHWLGSTELAAACREAANGTSAQRRS